MQDWSAVAAAVTKRMNDCGLSQKDVAAKSGVATSTIRELKKGHADRNWTPATLANVSRALGWQPSYLLAVANHDPLPEEPPCPGLDEDALLTELRAIREHLSRIDNHLSKLTEDRSGTPGAT